jgi:hypothetical protein
VTWNKRKCIFVPEKDKEVYVHMRQHARESLGMSLDQYICLSIRSAYKTLVKKGKVEPMEKGG